MIKKIKILFIAMSGLLVLCGCSPKTDEKPDIKHYSNYIDKTSSVTFDYKHPNYGVFKYDEKEVRVDGSKTYEFISKFDKISFGNSYAAGKVDELIAESNVKDYIMIDVSYHWVTSTDTDDAIPTFYVLDNGSVVIVEDNSLKFTKYTDTNSINYSSYKKEVLKLFTI